MKKRKRVQPKPVIKNSAIMLLIAAVLIALPILIEKVLPASWVSDTFKPISRTLTRGLSYIFGALPFSAAEILLYLLIIGITVYIVRTIVLMVRNKQRMRTLFRSISVLAVTVGSFFFVFSLFWGMNYFSLSLADELDMDVGVYSVKALKLTTESLASELNSLAGEVPRNSEGISDFGSFSGLSAMASEGWRKLASENAAFEGAGASGPKPVLMSKAMSYAGISGIYIPFTGEANVNADIPDSSLPFTMSHELAHAAGVAPENEANYASFLACRSNPHPEFRYSGYLTAYIYSYNALFKADASAAAEVRGTLDKRVLADLREWSEYWAKFDGKIQKAATKMNNTYLMAMSQTDGVKSYGMVVDLLIADYVSRNGNPDLA